jgi:oligoendopeptidase F
MSTTPQNGSNSMPRWDFTAIETQIDNQKKEAEGIIGEIPSLLEEGESLVASGASADDEDLIWLEGFLRHADLLTGLLDQLFSHAYCTYSIETGNSQRVKALNMLEAMTVPLRSYFSRFRKILQGILKGRNLPADDKGVKGLVSAAPSGGLIPDLEYFIQREVNEAAYQMSPELEELASDLQRSAGDAWGRLQGSLSSEMSAEWNSVTHERKTLVELRNLAYDPRRWVRKKAYALELMLWEQNKQTFAAAINGVKGNSLTVYERRGYEDFLQPSILSNRISRKTLDALIGAMEKGLPRFRRYLKAKAAYLGIPKLGFYDIFAPIGDHGRRYSYDEARDHIIELFNGFSADLGNFARTAFDRNWIDAEPRAGKVGGAYMTDFPLSEEARIMANFDGSFSALSTLAHELGHGYHSHKLEGYRYLNRGYPMTLAETASTFCETIVYNAAIDGAAKEERPALIEGLLMENTQVIVDILSRFYFERELFTRRKEGEVSSDELCEIMIDAQKKTYGDGLDAEELHPYMWAVKGHYYSVDLAFYNYPYAFGQLFAMGLYAQFRKDPEGFPARYEQVLKNTGLMSAVDVCAASGFDIESESFWTEGLEMLEPFVRQFEEDAPGLSGSGE